MLTVISKTWLLKMILVVLPMCEIQKLLEPLKAKTSGQKILGIHVYIKSIFSILKNHL